MFFQNHTLPVSKNRIDPSYINILNEHFVTDVANIHQVDFLNGAVEATDYINEWVSSKTRGNIPNMFPQPVDSNTIVMLASTLYFQGLPKAKKSS